MAIITYCDQYLKTYTDKMKEKDAVLIKKLIKPVHHIGHSLAAD
jgi:hypothetical protein